MNMKVFKRTIVTMMAVVALATSLITPVLAAAPANYKQAIDIVATAYAPGPHDNGKWGNLTHIGTQVRPGIIAVDPRIIPLKSKVYIEFPDGTGRYAIAEDTGGAIKGNRIDIAMWTVDEAYKFGMKNVKLYVVE
ncbi:MAG: yocH 3 [Anaerosporomusa subterranea]|jgi:3D (Asp-Asp-Asp) domain-containing protein|nr:yocH 3 [Anaerosporomusa subterranea]